MEFVDKYKEYVSYREDKWLLMLDKVDNFIILNKRLPLLSINTEKKIAIWIDTQIRKYKKKNDIMKNKYFYDKWSEFTQKHKKYFCTGDEMWNIMFDETKKYIESNNKRPPRSSKDDKIKKLGKWVHNQQNYHKKNKFPIDEKNRYEKWDNFRKQYPNLFP